MKVVPGAASSSSLTNKNVRYMENSKMLPPSKRFKMENSVPVHQNGIEVPRTGGTAVTPVNPTLKPCSVSVSPLVIPNGSKLLTTTADSSSRSPGSTSAKMPSTQAPSPPTPMAVTSDEGHGEGPLQTVAELEPLSTSQEQVLSTTDITAQMKELEKTLGSRSETTTDTKTPKSGSVQTPESTSIQTPESNTVQTLTSSQNQQRDLSQSDTRDTCVAKELQEGQEIYIQTEGLTVQLSEPGSDRIVIVNGPDGTTMHIQTPEGVPLEAVQALLGIEASDGAKAPQ
uniref:mucin-5AC-like n=1 Tax=Monopterus albus TaxID=43700 RepID=UPI0009B42BB6|nr:mucin-5AC-like [Monopterus albus]